MLFIDQFHCIFYISEIAKYCADKPVDIKKEHLIGAMLSCFGGPSRSFSAKLLVCLSSFYSSCRGQKKDKFSNLDLEYCELYHELCSNESPSCPIETEIRRRKRISKTKQSRNRKSISLRKMHIKTILDRLESEKRTYSNLPVHERNKKEKPTRQRICKSYFEQHTEELKKLQITSPRTLENLCSRKASGKHADEIRRQRNSINASSPIYEPKLYSELDIRIES